MVALEPAVVRRVRRRDDRGGVWIRTGLVLGALVYAGVVVMAAAGFTGAVPLVVVPPVLVAIIGGNNLIGGGRTPGRTAGRPTGQGRAPLSSSATDRTGRTRGPRRRPRPRRARRGPMTLFRDRGMVLRTIRLGEADRIVTLMTEQHGKVRAVAKGVRRTRSKFGSRLEPLSHVALLGWQGRGDLDIVNQVEVIDTNRAVREDLDRMAAAMSMLETVDQIGQERHANPRLYEMLVGAVAALGRARPARWSPRPSSSRSWRSRARLRCSTPAFPAARGTPPNWWRST